MLSSTEAFEKHRTKIEAVSEEEMLSPHMPREEIVGENRAFNLNVQADAELLLKNGLDPEYLSSLDERISAFAHTYALYETSQFGKPEARLQWEQKFPEVNDFKWDMIDTLLYALRKEKDSKKVEQIKMIAKGKGKRDLVFDLKDISFAIENNRPALEKINFDFLNAEKSRNWFDEFSNLLAASEMSPAELDEAKTMAFKAYTYLMQAVKEIRDCGQFVFRKDEARLALYKSEWYQELGKMKKTPSEQPAQPAAK